MNYRWLTELSQIFLERDYLVDGQTVDQRVDVIVAEAERILGIPGFAARFKENLQKGWYSLSTPIWTNFGTDRGLEISCFGSSISDSMESILYTQAEVGMMTKNGGGTSGYFGNLRERGAKISRNGESSGSVHFMQLFDNLINIVSQGKCYAEGTEVLTAEGFKDFREIQSFDRLAQVDSKGNVSFTKDYQLVVEDFDGLIDCYRSKKDNNFNIVVTPNHRMVVNKKSGDTWFSESEIVISKDFILDKNVRFVFAGKSKSGEGMSFEDRLRVAFQAYGIKDGQTRCVRIELPNASKMERLEWILKNLNISPKIVFSENTLSEHYIEFTLPIMPEIKQVAFDDWINISEKSSEWSEEFLEEVFYWADNYFETSLKGDVDVIQALASICGKNAIVRDLNQRSCKNYLVCLNDNPSCEGDMIERSYESYNGKVYCAVVEEGRLIVRYKNSVMVCGNTRRGNFAAYLPVEHPDILEFLTIRNEGSPLQDISFGVTVGDAWMESMIAGDMDKRKIWAKILEHRSNTGYPYIMFSDTVNRETVDVYKDKDMKITHSNLCVTGDQLVVTSEGLRTVKELYLSEEPLVLFDGEKPVTASQMRLVEKDVDIYEIKTISGMSHKVTSYHKVKTPDGMVEAKNILIGKSVCVQSNKGLFGSYNNPELAFLLGLYHSYRGVKIGENLFIDLRENILNAVENLRISIESIYDKNNWNEVIQPIEYHNEFVRFDITKLENLGFVKYVVPRWIMVADEETQLKYIEGLNYLNFEKFTENTTFFISSIVPEFEKNIHTIVRNLGYECSSLSDDHDDFFSLEDTETSKVNREIEYVSSVEIIGKEDVYCTTVDSDEHVWVCNGFITSNCSEIMLPDSDDEFFVCDLSSMNIVHYEEWKDTDAVELLVYFLDAVMTGFIEKAKDIKFMERPVKFARNHRALGIGWIGWHTFLQSQMIPFESTKAKFLNVEVAKNIKTKAYVASKKLAEIYGEPEMLKGYGRRNSTLLAIAPTKSSAFILGQVSEGIEPHRTNYYIKDLQKGKFTIKNAQLEALLESKGLNNDQIWDSILKSGGSVQHLDVLTDEEKMVFKTFAEISPKEIIIQAAQRQKHIDQSQSLNLMIHPSISVKDVNALIIEAWKLGVKSLYYQISVNAAQSFTRDILSCASCES